MPYPSLSMIRNSDQSKREIGMEQTFALMKWKAACRERFAGSEVFEGDMSVCGRNLFRTPSPCSIAASWFCSKVGASCSSCLPAGSACFAHKLQPCCWLVFAEAEKDNSFLRVSAFRKPFLVYNLASSAAMLARLPLRLRSQGETASGIPCHKQRGVWRTEVLSSNERTQQAGLISW